MNPNIKAQEIIKAFQRYLVSNDPSEINTYSLSELRSADEQWGNRDLNANYRIALRNRIKEIEEENQKKYQSKVRIIGYIISFCLGVLATVVAYYLTRQL